MAAVGDKVLYIPSIAHCYDRDLQGNFAWQFSRQNRGNGRDSVELLDDAEVGRILNQAQSQKNFQLKASLTPVQPKARWQAVIRNIIGTVADLDVTHVCGGVTLHYDGVPYDVAGTKPHTWTEGK